MGQLAHFLSLFSHEVYGVDVSRYAIKTANRKYADIFFGLCDVENHAIPFQGNFFDIVFMVHVLEHFHNLNNVFSEIKRILLPHGLLVLVVPNCGLTFDYLIKHQKIGYDDASHVNFFSYSELKRIVEKEGFNVNIAFTYPPPFLWMVSPTLAKFLSFSLGKNIYIIAKQ